MFERLCDGFLDNKKANMLTFSTADLRSIINASVYVGKSSRDISQMHLHRLSYAEHFLEEIYFKIEYSANAEKQIV